MKINLVLEDIDDITLSKVLSVLEKNKCECSIDENNVNVKPTEENCINCVYVKCEPTVWPCADCSHNLGCNKKSRFTPYNESKSSDERTCINCFYFGVNEREYPCNHCKNGLWGDTFGYDLWKKVL